MARLNLKGLRFGRLVVLREAGTQRYRGGHVNVTWLCLCDCGSEKEVSTNRLRTGNTKSCGCLLSEAIPPRKKKTKSSAYKVLVDSMKRRAVKSRGLSWSLSYEEAFSILACNCLYCGSPPSQRHTNYPEWPYNGIDRIDNNKGYESGNVIPCCGTCNRAKSNMSLTDFENWIVRVYSQFSSSMWNGAHEKVGYEFRGLSCVEGP